MKKIATDPDTSFVVVATLGQNVTNITQPTPGGTYAWRVIAGNGASDSSYSNTVTGTVTWFTRKMIL